jgi:ABC-2 type transport system ATP-binding protein
VVLDEPTTGLDPESRQRVWGLVEELASSGSTVLFTTHYLTEAEALADRVAIMHDGKVRVEGALAEVLSSRPARVTAVLPAGFPALPAFSGHVVVSGLELTVETSSLQDDLLTLLSWASSHGVRLDGLNATQASLEAVFLQLGRS